MVPLSGVPGETVRLRRTVTAPSTVYIVQCPVPITDPIPCHTAWHANRTSTFPGRYGRPVGMACVDGGRSRTSPVRGLCKAGVGMTSTESRAPAPPAASPANRTTVAAAPPSGGGVARPRWVRGVAGDCCPETSAPVRCPVPHHGHISHPRPPDRTCGFSASGFPTSHALPHGMPLASVQGTAGGGFPTAVRPDGAHTVRPSPCASDRATVAADSPVCAAVTGWDGLACLRWWFTQSDSIRSSILPSPQMSSISISRRFAH